MTSAAKFTSDEAAAFFNKVMGLGLSATDIDALEARTEGWIAGLQLAAMSMQGANDTSAFIDAFAGNNRYIMDYLIEEVLDQQPENVQSFLLQTAVLDRLTGSLCDALTGQQNGQDTLQMLEQSNLFIIPLDNERRWYRYHHLFSDLLSSRLLELHRKDITDLHLQASIWYENNSFPGKDISCFKLLF